jgi:hypothetical protein
VVVIVDGLDECRDEHAQQEIIKLIGEYVEMSKGSPTVLLWLVCSRPEWHLKRVFNQAQSRIDFDREEITCNAAEDIEDVYRILKDGLQNVHETLRCGLSGVQWPTEARLQQLSQRVGGLPVLADAILRFIGDGSGSPDSQLDICLLFLETTGEGTKARNPLHALDTFYRQILSRVPRPILTITKQILAFYILSLSYNPLPDREFGDPLGPFFEAIFDVVRFLGIDMVTLYSALRYLHSIIEIPSAELVYQMPLKFFHKSFQDFLQDSTRSQTFALDMNQARYDIAALALRWLSCSILQPNCELESESLVFFSLSIAQTYLFRLSLCA